MMPTSHSDPSRPMREDDAAASAKRPARSAQDTEAREQRLQYEREVLNRNRHVEQQLDHALVESFPASDPLAVTPEGVFPVRDPRLADEASGEAGRSPEAPGPSASGACPDAPRHGGRGPRHAQRRPDPQTPSDPAEPLPDEPIARGAGEADDKQEP